MLGGLLAPAFPAVLAGAADAAPALTASLMVAAPAAVDLTLDAVTTSALETPLATTVSVGPVSTAAAPPAEAVLAGYWEAVADATDEALRSLAQTGGW